ncbi:T9SS type A sorting domain-containing protein [Fulvivirga sp. M361]|uniref:T9SS type A sorting domain-containing protein n=1 Tax=Fulvivirga sp. M361 TaxID=2594266 RepID=UPI00117A4105|nr:T9SS type A sorting domain-containing protein [Fulvivirga sp. M361]TRX60139.1 T9SS type A sorting domain-containing protein [Fulvivirga sp. M361]
MIKNSLFPIAILLFLSWQDSSAQSGICNPDIIIPDEFESNEFDHDGVTIPYRLLTPEIPDSNQKLPLIVALHGAENFGSPRDRFLMCAGSYALGWLAPSLQKKYPSYVIAPHLYDDLFFDGYDGWDEEKPLDFLKRLIDQLLATEKIDPNRIYLTGHSMGGIGTFTVPVKLKDYFAALMPMNTAGGCPEVCEIINNKVYDNLSIWAIHHRNDAANSNVRDVFDQLKSQGKEVYSTHSFGDEIINLKTSRIEELIEEHQRYFHTEYRYSCHSNGIFFCHTSSMDTILRDPLFQKWVFRQHKVDADAIQITSADSTNNYAIHWKAKNPLDSLEVWFRTSAATKWSMLDKIPAGKGSFELVPAVMESDIGQDSKVKLVLLNDTGFTYGFAESDIKKVVTGIPEKHKKRKIFFYPNPASKVIHFKLPDDISGTGLKYKYKVMSTGGAIMQQGEVQENRLDVTELPIGIYLLVLESNTQLFKQRLVLVDPAE